MARLHAERLRFGGLGGRRHQRLHGGAWPELRGELVLLPYFNVATAPLGHNARASVLPGGEGAWDTRRVLSSFRTDRSGRLVLGSVGALRGARRRHPRVLGAADAAAAVPAGARRALRGRLVRPHRHDRDDLPRFHRLAPNVVGFSGYNGRGIGPGTAFGRVLAEHVLGALREADLPLPVTEPRPAPFRRAREAAYEAGARLAHVAGARGV